MWTVSTRRRQTVLIHVVVLTVPVNLFNYLSLSVYSIGPAFIMETAIRLHIQNLIQVKLLLVWTIIGYRTYCDKNILV